MSFLGYRAFRELANPGGTPAADGLPEWPIALLRANGFDGGFEIENPDALPFRVSCNEGAPDAVENVDEFDWFVSQGAESGGPFELSRATSLDPVSLSGSIVLSLSAWAAALYPTPFDVSTIEVLFFAVDLYVRRRSDGAIQRLDLRRAIYEANAPQTGIG